jgi:hypothetical protein
MSKATREKLTVISSVTGRRPHMADPIDAPTKPSSEIGVSTTRIDPYLARRPSVTRYEPPNLPISSPIR